jgi:hypothetical protein
LFTKKERSKRREYLEKVSLRSSLLQDFLNAANIQKIVLQLFCSDDKKKNLASFNNAIVYDLANDYVTKAMHTYNKYKKCIPKNNDFIDGYIITHLYQMNHESDLERFTARKSIKIKYAEKLGHYFETLYWKYSGKEKKKEILYSSKLADLKCKSCLLFAKAHKRLKKLSKSISKNLGKKIKKDKKFNPEKFNARLSSRLTSIKPVLKEGDELLALAHPQISILAYDKLTSYIESFSKQVKEIEAPIKDKAFEKQFRPQMVMLSNQIKSQKKTYIKNANTFIEKNEVLSFEQKRTHMGFEILQIGETRAPAGRMLSTLDLEK